MHEELLSDRIESFRKKLYLKLTRGQVSKRSGLSLAQVVPELKLWAYSKAAGPYVVAWDQCGREGMRDAERAIVPAGRHHSDQRSERQKAKA